MITELTEKQKLKIPYYFNKWQQIGYEYKPIDRDYAKKLLTKYLKVVNIPSKYFIFLDSPFACQLAINGVNFLLGNQPADQLGNQPAYQLLRQLYSQPADQLGNQPAYQLLRQLYSQLDSQLYSQLSSCLYRQLYSQLDSQLSSKLSSQLSSQLRSQLSSQLSSQLYSQLSRQLSRQLSSQLDSQLDSQLSRQLSSQLDSQKLTHFSQYYFSQCGNINAGYCAFYDFLIEEVKTIDKKAMDIWQIFKGISEHLHCFFVFKNIVFCSEKPTELHFKNILLHNDDGPAVKYADGYSLYSLNGITMPREIVETHAENIDPKLALNEKNADVQREIIRKIGYDRMLKACNAKTIEEWQCPKTKLKYTVRLMKIGGINRRYLCYEHASMPGIYYAKCMPPEAKTIIQMRAFQTGVFGFNPDEARQQLSANKLSDEELLKRLPTEVR